MQTVKGGVIAARGFLCAGVSAGIKTRPGALDLGMIFSERPAVAAAMFTTNRVQAAPVKVSRVLLRHRTFRGIVVNAGNANACTGNRGLRDARRMAELASQATGSSDSAFLVASTGIIGRLLPFDKIADGIQAAARQLGSTAAHAASFARAIMTTDTVPKEAAVEVLIGKVPVRIGGVCKGAGMIAPNMATMLAFLTTDCAIARPLLARALRQTVARTFNCVTVDGDRSTNDTVAILANGAARNPEIETEGKDYSAFCGALYEVCSMLAQAIARDGEGATRFVEVAVMGGRTDREADSVARAIANSLLVKCAIHGGDPNWGRIICAAGYSGAPVQPERMRLWINGQILFRNGRPAEVSPDKLAACMKPKEIRIKLDLGRGKAAATIWTCDISKEYVSINADYHT